jgi:hypothetical protein
MAADAERRRRRSSETTRILTKSQKAKAERHKAVATGGATRLEYVVN